MTDSSQTGSVSHERNSGKELVLKKELLVTALLMLMVACIGWSSDQREVVENYNSLIEYADEENWNDLSKGLSEGSIQLLDEIATIYTEAGVPFNNQGEELLASLVSDTDLLSFSETIISINFRNDRALLQSGQGNSVDTYEFLMEGRQWKLNLVPMLNSFLAEIMEGIPPTEQNSFNETSSTPTYISLGNGTCEFGLRNDLTNLSLWNVYCSPSNSDSWGEDWLASSILGSGSEIGIWLEEDVYDIQLVDSEGNTYTLWQVELNEEGVFWPVTEMDRDEPI